MQRALPSQRGTNGFLESPEASQGVGLAPPEPGDGSTSARKYLPQLEPTALEKEVLELREQLAEQDLRLKTERKEIEKREALVRYAAGAAKKDVLDLQDSNKRAKQALNAANLRVKELEQSVQHLTSKLRHLEEQLRDQSRQAEDTASTEVVLLKQELAERQGEVESLKGDVARLEQALQEAPALLADKDAQLAQLQEELQRVRLERDAEAQRLTAQLDESRKSVASLQDALPKDDRAYQRELAQLSEAYQAKAAEAARLRHQLARERSVNDAAALQQGGRPWWQRYHLQQ